jgi:sugar (pentulose or hexulose) kinase
MGWEKTMTEPLILTFDVGTQSARALLVDKHGATAAMKQEKYAEPYFSKNPGWAEQTPDFYYDCLCRVGRALCDENPDKLGRIIAVTITTIRDTVLCLDGDNRPLRDVILWLDKRQARFDDPYPRWKRMLFSLIGMEDATKILYRSSPGNWIMQNEPEIWEKTAKFVMLPTYLNYKLTGVLADTPANMIGHMPFDYKNRRWMGERDLTRCFCDVPKEKLCRLIPSGSTVGELREEFSAALGLPAGLPLISTGSDKGCETLGLSVLTPDKASLSFGTTATIQLAVKKYFEPQKFLPAYPAVVGDMYNPEIEIYRGFWLLSWFIKEFGAAEVLEAGKRGCSPEKILDERILDIPAGSDGLLLQPYWTSGILKPDSMGAVVGFTDFHSRYHLYRAIIEGIDMELYQALRIMEKRSGLEIKELFVSGGGSRSDTVCRITADVFGLPVKRIQTPEACSIGSSMAALVALGVYDSFEQAAKEMVHETRAFLPDANNHRIYMEIYEKAYSRIYGKLQPIYRSLNDIYKRR